MEKDTELSWTKLEVERTEENMNGEWPAVFQNGTTDANFPNSALHLFLLHNRRSAFFKKTFRLG